MNHEQEEKTDIAEMRTVAYTLLDHRHEEIMKKPEIQ
jgi:hypothetical protein